MKAPSFAILVHLGENMWGDKKAQKTMHFDREVWNNIIDKCEKEGLDTIILDLGEGVKYPSHPEIGIEGAWTPEEVKAEVARLKTKGIRVIPKMNFSAVHDAWMGEYERMVSTSIYYKVVRDLIFDAYDLFDKPEYIHIGMDEESVHHAKDPMYSYVVIRRDERLLEDMKIILDFVRETGATPFMWGTPLMDYPETAFEYAGEDVVIGKGMYYEYKRENWTKIADQSQEVIDFYATRFVEKYGYTIEYVEESPSVPKSIQLMKDCAAKGMKIAPTASNLFIKTNDRAMVEYYSEIETGKSVAMYIAAPWVMTRKENEAAILEEIELLGSAKREFYAE